MKYELFLFDLDDTLLDFKASERLSFFLSLKTLGIEADETFFKLYQEGNQALWKQFEENKVTKDFLKVERFRLAFDKYKIDADPTVASARYLEALPETVVLMDHAVETCEWLKSYGELGIITNGIQTVQHKRIKNSKIAPYIDFIAVSDECGHAKPDVRFFEYTVKKAKHFQKNSTLIVGDRLDADIKGAHNFGIDSCWLNPERLTNNQDFKSTYEVKHLAEIKAAIPG